MMNWFWVIPWVVIIIFFAGWKIGEKISKKRWDEKDCQLREDEYRRRYEEDTIHNIYKSIDRLDEKIERLYATKEDKNNG